MPTEPQPISPYQLGLNPFRTMREGHTVKIHTDTITRRDLHEAVGPLDGVHVEIEDEGSASRNHGFVIHLTADPRKGRRRVNYGTSRRDRYDR